MIYLRLFFCLLALASLYFGYSVDAQVRAAKDTGDASLEAIDAGIKIDCETRELTVSAIGRPGKNPISDAEIFLFYTDYGYNLISQGKTDESGTGKVSAIGKLDFLKNLFIIRIDSASYRSRQVEFTFLNCFYAPKEAINASQGAGPSPYPGNSTGAQQPNASESIKPLPPLPQNEAKDNVSVPSSIINKTFPLPEKKNAPINGPFCPASLAFALLLFFAFLHSRNN